MIIVLKEGNSLQWMCSGGIQWSIEKFKVTQYLVHHSQTTASLHNPKVTAPLFLGKWNISLDPELNGCSGHNPAVQKCSARRHNGLKCILNLIVCNCTPSCLMHSKRMSFWMEMTWCSMQPSAGRESQAAGTKSVLECAGMCVFLKADHTPHL